MTKHHPTLREAREYILRSGDAYADYVEAYNSGAGEGFLKRWGLDEETRKRILEYKKRVG